VIKAYGLSEHDAMEVYQDAVVTFYENVINNKLNELSSSVKTYVFAIGKYKTYEKLRGLSKTINMDDNLHLAVDEPPDMEALMQRERRLDVLAEHFSEITSKCREILKLFYYEKARMEDIMKIFDYKNIATVKNQKYKCMQRLRKLIHTNVK
jgi:RNA polymerase sigma-70 factor (ECF subfamily)